MVGRGGLLRTDERHWGEDYDGRDGDDSDSDGGGIRREEPPMEDPPENVPPNAEPPADMEVVEDERNYLPEDHANALSFADFCDMLDKLEEISKKKNKSEAKLKEALGLGLSRKIGRGQSVYPYLRLLIPEADSRRGAYRLKEAMLASHYADLLGLKDTDKGKRLRHYTNNSYNKMHTGDLSCTLCEVMEAYERTKRSTLTIGQINSLLDRLASASDKETQIPVLKEIRDTCSARDHKWIIRIIIKTLKIGLSKDSVLGYLHPRAKELHDSCNDLRRVCTAIQDEVAVSKPVAVELNTGSNDTTFKPMLSAKLPNMDFSGIVEQLGNVPFLMEVKLDGERMICHKNGKKVSFFSRKGHNYTTHYGKVMTDTICECFESAEDCVIDGEMVSWDNEIGRLVPFGNNKTQARNMELFGAAGVTKWLFYVVFDIVYLDGAGAKEHIAAAIDDVARRVPSPSAVRVLSQREIETGSITQLPLMVRRALLQRVMVQKEHKIELARSVEVSEHKSVEERQKQLFDYFDEQAILRGEEGLIVKDLTTPYTFGEQGRKTKHWIKMKPDYSDQVRPLDVVIVGGYWGEGASGGSRTGILSSFLMAIKGDDDDRYYTCGKVGTGYCVEDLKKINEMLKDKWMWVPVGQKSSDFKEPDFLPQHSCARDRPACFIHPRDSIVLAVKFSECPNNGGFSSGFVMRFPRVQEIRWDKKAEEVDTISSAQAIRNQPRTSATEAAAGKGQKRKKGDDGGKGKKQKKRKANYLIDESMQLEAKSDIFIIDDEGDATIELCLYNADYLVPLDLANAAMYDTPQSTEQNGNVNAVVTMNTDGIQRATRIERDKLYKICREHGATVTIVPQNSTTYIIADCWVPKHGDRSNFLGDIKTQALIKSGEYTVLDPTWLLSCAARREVRFPSPAQRRSVGPSLREQIRGYQDEYGDCYMDETTPDLLDEVFGNMSGAANKGEGYDWRQAASEKLKTPEELDMFTTAGTALWRPTVVFYVDMYSDLGRVEELPEGQNLKTTSGMMPMPYSSLTGTAYAIKLMGGHISSHLSIGVTHVVMDPSDMRRARAIRERLKELHTHRETIAGQWCHKRVVSPDWIYACAQGHRPVEAIDDAHKVRLAD